MFELLCKTERADGCAHCTKKVRTEKFVQSRCGTQTSVHAFPLVISKLQITYDVHIFRHMTRVVATAEGYG